MWIFRGFWKIYIFKGQRGYWFFNKRLRTYIFLNIFLESESVCEVFSDCRNVDFTNGFFQRLPVCGIFKEKFFQGTWEVGFLKKNISNYSDFAKKKKKDFKNEPPGRGFFRYSLKDWWFFFIIFFQLLDFFRIHFGIDNISGQMIYLATLFFRGVHVLEKTIFKEHRVTHKKKQQFLK